MDRKKVIVTEHINESGINVLRASDIIEIVNFDGKASEGEIDNAMPDASAILVRSEPVTREMIQKAPKLEIIAKHGVGYDNIDVAAATETKIPVIITPEANSDSVAELTKFEIPAPTVIPGNGYVRFTEFSHFGVDALGPVKGFALSELGETVYLSSGSGSMLSEPAYRVQQEFGPAERNTTHGRYRRSNGETDFVAQNDDFQALQKDICMQIAAMNPKYISENDIPAEILEKEKEIYREQMQNSGKPDNIIEKIIEGKLKKYYTEVCLLHQAFFKEDKKSIQDLIAEKIHKLGENIAVKRFVRYQIGE